MQIKCNFTEVNGTVAWQSQCNYGNQASASTFLLVIKVQREKVKEYLHKFNFYSFWNQTNSSEKI